MHDEKNRSDKSFFLPIVIEETVDGLVAQLGNGYKCGVSGKDAPSKEVLLGVLFGEIRSLIKKQNQTDS